MSKGCGKWIEENEVADYKTRRKIMVDTQIRPCDVTKFPIIDAFLSVPREKFVPDGKREAAYIGENFEIGQNRVILEPRTLAKLLDAPALITTTPSFEVIKERLLL